MLHIKAFNSALLVNVNDHSSHTNSTQQCAIINSYICWPIWFGVDPNSEKIPSFNDQFGWIWPQLWSKCDNRKENWSFHSLAKESPWCITKGRAQNGLELLILIPALYWMALWLGFMHLRLAAYSNLSSFWTDHISRGICNFAQTLCQLSWRLEVAKGTSINS